MLRNIFVSILLFFISAVVIAQTDPQELVEEVSNEMLATLQQQRAQLKGHPEKIIPIVNKLLLPYADVETMSRAVLGKHWHEATPAQQKRFEAEFTKLVVRTYAKAFEQYTTQTIDFLKPVPIGSTGDKVEIKTLIKQTGSPSIPVNYRLVQRGATWKMYDINVDGVSLIASYRGQFASQIAKNGLDSVIDMMASRNK